MSNSTENKYVSASVETTYDAINLNLQTNEDEVYTIQIADIDHDKVAEVTEMLRKMAAAFNREQNGEAVNDTETIGNAG